jgi:uncharacterized protein (DUF1015 family)
MADVRPFRGLRYNPAVVSDIAQVVTPPYDVISPTMQAEYYERNPFNIIQLELGRETPQDDHLDNRYTRAAAIFANWRLNGVLQEDPVPAFYVYQQQFTAQERDYTRTSILARVRLEPWEADIVLPHEHTLSKAKDDRLKLLRACVANLSSIMSLYDDPDGAIFAILKQVTEEPPVSELTDDDGEHHRLWQITSADLIDTIHTALADRQLFIADGHHRYETALNYREEVRALHRGLSPDEAANFVLMALIATDDPGLVVLPTHRLVSSLSDQQLAALPVVLASNWEMTELAETSDLRELLSQAGEVPTIIVATREHRWLLRVSAAGRHTMAQIDEPEAWQELDVALVQELVIDRAFGIDREHLATSEKISYTRDIADALAALDDGRAQVAILLNATRPTQIRDVALAHGRMPQKSTYFYPKLITGIVINPVW